ncbi:cupin domain [Pseudonocardia sediminis]|uniref:Cupin domain n=1 Tax=Pseudonocardia sediminis TaxID=1397368 RepID=A0A4V2FQ86_PSEST|nr:cupin domain-containing protein [Pseudonocardia sediminis]RZT83800.1 cupin domain [Pseudonocardia sediminis]
MQILRAAGHFAVPEGEPNQYREHLRTADLSVGTYCIPVGGKDGQEPHTEDEIYVVVRGRAKLVSETAEAGADGTRISTEYEIGPGSVVHLPAREVHHFTEVTEDLSIVVVFAPAERSRGLDRDRDAYYSDTVIWAAE